MEIFASNNNDMLKKAVLAIREHGTESDPGNAEINTDGTRFIDGVTITVADPRDRWLNIEGRNSSALAAIGETFWVLAGRNDMNFLSRVLPRALNFSDDGVTWRGAYGPRLYRHGQLDSVINRLRQNPNTRQAYLTIYDPALDTNDSIAANRPDGQPVTKDMICNIALLFSITDSKLNLTVINRSQDVLWGMSSINFIEFTIIQEVVAKVLGIDVGYYKLFSNNLHYYNNEVSQKQLGKITEATRVRTSLSSRIEFGPTGPFPIQQESIRSLFASTLALIENGHGLDFLFQNLETYGVDPKGKRGLIRDMAYCLWCRLNNELINPNEISDMGLVQAICCSPVDKKYVDQKYLEGAA